MVLPPSSTKIALSENLESSINGFPRRVICSVVDSQLPVEWHTEFSRLFNGGSKKAQPPREAIRALGHRFGLPNAIGCVTVRQQ